MSCPFFSNNNNNNNNNDAGNARHLVRLNLKLYFQLFLSKIIAWFQLEIEEGLEFLLRQGQSLESFDVILYLIQSFPKQLEKYTT